MTAKEKLHRIDNDIQKLSHERNIVHALTLVYDDLEIEQERSHEYFVSKSINSVADNYYTIEHIHHLLVKCYKKVLVVSTEVTIYAQPMYIDVGIIYSGNDVHLHYDYAERLLSHNINEELVQKIGRDFSID